MTLRLRLQYITLSHMSLITNYPIPYLLGDLSPHPFRISGPLYYSRKLVILYCSPTYLFVILFTTNMLTMTAVHRSCLVSYLCLSTFSSIVPALHSCIPLATGCARLAYYKKISYQYLPPAWLKYISESESECSFI